MKQLASALGLLNLVHKQNIADNPDAISAEVIQKEPPQADSKPVEKNVLNKEELRLLVKILKAVGHTCEHNRISIESGITHYQLAQTTLIFDDVNHKDTSSVLHLSPLTEMQTNPDLKRPTWEKLKALKD